MPQSLTVSGSSSSASSAKRQRSADGREVPTQAIASLSGRNNGSMNKSTVRIPRFLDKSKTEIAQAFQDLEWKQRFRLFHAMENPNTSPFRVDRSETVINRNRYGNVQPWDNARVKLRKPIGGSDYINASPILIAGRAIGSRPHTYYPPEPQSIATADTEPQSLQGNRYIATQGPKDGLYSHFWNMVMQETTGDVGVIVMLTQCYEANKEKCAQYFPKSMDNPTIILAREDDKEGKENHGPEKASTASSQDYVTLRQTSEDDSTASQLRVLDLNIGGRTKTIYHYLFRGWPDFGKPDAEDRIALVELSRQSRRIAGGSPRIVHCSAGVGRTGTFIALDFLTHEIDEGRIPGSDSSDSKTLLQDDAIYTETWGKSGPPKVQTPTGGDFPSGEDNRQLKEDLIYGTVNILREQRMMMVMNELQYAFIYEVIREVFLAKYKARPEGAVVKGLGDGLTDRPKGKIAKVDEEENASGSEAETEIMEGEEDAAKTTVERKVQAEGDPYNIVAPEHILEGIRKGQS